MGAEESSRTWAAIKGPCPGGHPPESGDSNTKDQKQDQPEGASPLPGNSATKKYIPRAAQRATKSYDHFSN